METPDESPTEGKRVGVHPIVVIFGVIIGLWLFITLIIPKSKNTRHQPGTPSSASQSLTQDTVSSELVPSFQVSSAIPGMNSVSIVVPPETTDSQITALILHLRKARLDETLSTMLPPTTLGNELGDFAIADLYVFSESEYGVADAAQALGRGAHAPGEFYPSSIPYEVAMEHVRGHYSIDLHNRTNPESASLGFGEEATGVYSKRFQRLF